MQDKMNESQKDSALVLEFPWLNKESILLYPDQKINIQFWQKRYNCNTNWDKMVQLLHKFGQNGTIVT